MSERLTRPEIEQWRRVVWERSAWFHADVLRALDYMLHLHDLVERLRKLQPEDATGVQIQAAERKVGACHTVWDRVREGDLIAAAVRVIVADHFVDANKKDDTHANS